MKSIYTCPYCGAKSFNPWKKAFAGGLRTKGKVCMECGQHCVNGVASMIFSAVVYRCPRGRPAGLLQGQFQLGLRLHGGGCCGSVRAVPAL